MKQGREWSKRTLLKSNQDRFPNPLRPRISWGIAQGGENSRGHKASCIIITISACQGLVKETRVKILVPWPGEWLNQGVVPESLDTTICGTSYASWKWHWGNGSKDGVNPGWLGKGWLAWCDWWSDQQRKVEGSGMDAEWTVVDTEDTHVMWYLLPDKILYVMHHKTALPTPSLTPPPTCFRKILRPFWVLIHSCTFD